MEISLQDRFRCSPLAYVCDAVVAYDLNSIVFLMARIINRSWSTSEGKV